MSLPLVSISPIRTRIQSNCHSQTCILFKCGRPTFHRISKLASTGSIEANVGSGSPTLAFIVEDSEAAQRLPYDAGSVTVASDGVARPGAEAVAWRSLLQESLAELSTAPETAARSEGWPSTSGRNTSTPLPAVQKTLRFPATVWSVLLHLLPDASENGSGAGPQGAQHPERWVRKRRQPTAGPEEIALHKEAMQLFKKG